MDYTVRAVVPQDGPAMRQLEEMIPEPGAFSVVYRSLFDPYEVTMALHPGALGVVAENPSGGLAGMGFVQMLRVTLDGKPYPLGRFFGIAVHPDHRRRGLATTLYHKLFELVRKQYGAETMFLAVIQQENEASLRAAKTWATQIVQGRLRYLSDRTVNRAPTPRNGLRIRPAEDRDWDMIAAGSNAFHREAEWAPNINAASLREAHEQKPFGFSLQACFVAVDHTDSPVAGIWVTLGGLAETGLYAKMPFRYKLMNAFSRFAPSGGVLKRLTVRDLWHTPGNESAALDLWKAAAWLLRDKGNRLMAVVDPKSPLTALLPKRTFQPYEGGLLAVAASRDVNLSRILYLPF